MLDINYIRDNREAVADSAKAKGIKVDLATLLALDEKRRELITKTEEVRAERNTLAAKSAGGKPSTAQIKQGKQLKDQLAGLESELAQVNEEYEVALKAVPNVSSEDTPIGAGPDDNKVVEEVGDKPNFSFKPLDHWTLAQERDFIDKERAAKVSGSRFAYIKGDLARLQLAIISFTVDKLSDESYIKEVLKGAKLNLPPKPFTLLLPPLMLKTQVFEAMDRLEPSEDRYQLVGEELWLQGSAEHVMGSMHMDEMFAEEDLPLRYLGYATSFRREAGTYGKDMEGIIRMHQFDKLEMETFSTPETGMDEHLLTIAIQEDLMKRLAIPYRKLLKCTADIGKPNARGVDLDAWLPGQGGYRETHTADYMTDYQARRLATRVKRASGAVDLVHTIDATAFALGRTMVAIIENYQTKDKKVTIPEALKPYMGNREEI